MNYKRFILAGIAIWIFGVAWAFLTCGWLFNWVYQIPPIIWKTPEEMMTTQSFLGSNAIGLLISLIFVLVYAVLYKGIPGTGVKKGLMYGLLVWAIGSLGMASLPYYMTIAPAVVLYWILNFLVAHLIHGLLVGAIYRPKN